MACGPVVDRGDEVRCFPLLVAGRGCREPRPPDLPAVLRVRMEQAAAWGDWHPGRHGADVLVLHRGAAIRTCLPAVLLALSGKRVCALRDPAGRRSLLLRGRSMVEEGLDPRAGGQRTLRDRAFH